MSPLPPPACFASLQGRSVLFSCLPLWAVASAQLPPLAWREYESPSSPARVLLALVKSSSLASGTKAAQAPTPEFDRERDITAKTAELVRCLQWYHYSTYNFISFVSFNLNNKVDIICVLKVQVLLPRSPAVKWAKIWTWINQNPKLSICPQGHTVNLQGIFIIYL